LELELQRLQEECNKQKFEITLMRSSSENEKNENSTFSEQLKMRYESELATLRNDRDKLREKIQESNQGEINKIKEVIRENNQLRLKMNSFIEENEELREQLEHSQTHNNSLILNHSKEFAQFTTKLSILQVRVSFIFFLIFFFISNLFCGGFKSEKESYQQQAVIAGKETSNLNEQIAANIRKLHDSERDCTNLRLKIEQIEHDCKKELANSKLEMVRQKGEQNRNKDVLNKQIEGLFHYYF
jgi:septal ring factor EnvC (AmiA/AmiB activator)